MAKIVPEGKRFQKGKSGNPLGGKLHDPEIKALKKLTKEELKEVGSLLLKGSVDELKEITKDRGASALKTMVASVCVRVIIKGDMHAFDVLLNRLIGKVKEEVEVSGPDGGPQVIVSLPGNGKETPK